MYRVANRFLESHSTVQCAQYYETPEIGLPPCNEICGNGNGFTFSGRHRELYYSYDVIVEKLDNTHIETL